MSVIVSWQNPASPLYTEIKVYRSPSPIDVQAPPSPIATLSVQAQNYTDSEPVDNAMNYYGVSYQYGDNEVFAFSSIETGSAVQTPVAPSAPTISLSEV